ncbi:MAG: hypothetical protein NTV46_00485 [Verrucomicrobia bacterium]|nr:hypothetical protein [Verrucomicrobiota bacterium]
MVDMLVALPMKFWESPPSVAEFKRMFPKGVPEDFVAISTGGAQNDINVLRLDECSIAIAVGQGENPDYASTINPIGRNLEVLRRSTDGWTDITKAVLPCHLRANEKAQLYRNGLLVITDASDAPLRTFRYDGTQFTPKAEQAVPSDGHKPSSRAPSDGSTAPADAH